MNGIKEINLLYRKSDFLNIGLDLPSIECVHCHAIGNKIKNNSSHKVKKL